MEKTPVPSSRPDLCVFICYSRVNMAEKRRLITHLDPLAKKLNVELWHDGEIAPGSEWRKAIEEKLAGMNIFLFLVSADSLASEFVNQVEYVRALEESRKRKVELIPILIQKCDWEVHDMSSSQCLPRNAIPIESWLKPEEGYAEVSNELRKHIEAKYLPSKQQPSKTAEATRDLSSANVSLKMAKQFSKIAETQETRGLSNTYVSPKTVNGLKVCTRQLSSGSVEIQSVLEEIGAELLYTPYLDPKYLFELNIFLREFHRAIGSGKKDIYTLEMQEFLISVCAKASYIAENASNRKQGQRFYEDVQKLGRQLIEIAAIFR